MEAVQNVSEASVNSKRPHYKEAIEFQLKQTLIGLLFIINAFLVDWIFGKAVTIQAGADQQGNPIAAISAMIGAVLLMYPILVTAWKDLLNGRLTINELVAIAVLAAFAMGEYRIAGVVAFFMLVGEIIESRTAEGARQSIESLIKLTPKKARRIRGDGGEDEVASHELAIGDRVRIRPGDNVAADGVIEKGQGSINQANITGESVPVDKGEGDEVFAGTVNLNGVLEVRVTRAGEDTTLGRVRELILAAEKTKLPIMRIIDQYMGYYTPLVLVIAALVWVFTQDAMRVISVLVVACPAAFILATPTAMVAALSAAARLGVLIKNVGDLEAAAKINAFVFDKTGTLTHGVLAVSRLSPVDGVSPAELLRGAAAAEKYSTHPTARALVALAGEAELELPEPENFNETAGKGVEATIDGARFQVGRAGWLQSKGVAHPFDEVSSASDVAGLSLIFVARDGQFIGWVGLQDQIRGEAKESLDDLRGAGALRVAMVSGDRKPVVDRVAGEIGCEEISAECLPEDKVEYVKGIRKRGFRTAVIGDGVNDAPALAAGDIGIAMGAAGSEAAIHSATIALMNNDLRRIPFLVRLSRGTRNVINQNFMFGILFILVGMGLAAFGYVSPVLAAALYNIGSLVVIFNSARLVRQGEELEPFEAAGAKEENESAASIPSPSQQPA